ncbi:hypothetical protein AJ79_09910 [Helicocarpus griseus UAMH5409]|uniref:SGNH hydrolase-type esterase domain-containing protein n=1 Tax=Helicocarpus griseus UAMH5409 TaxID=1447875 RepID=A0A2B7WGG8_9EURO|nr:hypothetical protein AJ79_09910 [Helicocarpus griseus UAMH5409]
MTSLLWYTTALLLIFQRGMIFHSDLGTSNANPTPAFALPLSELPAYDVHGDWLSPAEYKRQAGDPKVALRVLPLGASITFGTASSDGNGYRKALRDAMTFAGHSVDMVGSRRNGNMKDNENEGWPGYIIDDVHNKAELQYRLKPNLVLVNAGTNDCAQKIDFDGQPQRMKNLVEGLFNNIPGVTVILSGLLPNTDNDPCTKTMNDNYATIVDDLRSQDRKVVFANLYDGFITENDIADGVHPNDFGYQKMASVWWHAFTKAQEQEFITAPEENGLFGSSSTGVCIKKHDNPRALSIVFPCPANAEGQWKWWCGNTNGGRICDGRDSEYWDWVPGPIDHIATSAANEAPTVSTSLLPTSTSLLPTSRPSSETSPNSPGQGDNSAGTAPPDLSDMVKTSTPIAVGLGVGIPLLIIAAFATVLYFRERKAREKAERLHAATLGMGPQELMDLAKYKMDGTHGRVEMDWQTPRRHELQGRTVGEMRA